MFESAGEVSFRLFCNSTQCRSRRLRFDNANGFPINEKQIICRSRFGWIFAYCDTKAHTEIQFLIVLQLPSRGCEQFVNIESGFFFGSHATNHPRYEEKISLAATSSQHVGQTRIRFVSSPKSFVG